MGDETKTLAHEPDLVKECWQQPVFYLDGLCLATSFYSCRYQNQLAKPAMFDQKPCYECDKHKPKPIKDIVDWINQFWKRDNSGS